MCDCNANARQGATIDRRRDHAMSDIVEVGLLFVDVFGRDKGLTYFSCTVVLPHVYRRVLLGAHRRGGAKGEPDAFMAQA